MLSSHFDEIVNGLREDRNVTTSLKEVFSLSAKDLPRAKRLDVTKRVLSEIADKHSEHAHHAFLEAIRELRDLTPFLKRKERSLVYTVATVEKHSINHASYLCFDDQVERHELFPSLSNLTEEALKRIFEARVSSVPKRARRTSLAQTAESNLDVAKENRDPQLIVASSGPHPSNEAISDACLFHGASKYDKQALLPRKDSVTVATVIAGALVLKLALCIGTVPLSELLAHARRVVLPWVRYLQSVAKELEQQYQRICAAYLKRVQSVILNACRQEMEDPVIVVQARGYALTLTDMKLNHYARDLLRSVHSLTRGQRSEGLTHVFDIVGSVYDEALEHVSKFSMSDHRWFSEDVSAWMDHVAVVWSMRSVSKPVPALFAKRLSALRRVKDEVGILESCELQRHIMEQGLYAPQSLVERSDEQCVFMKAAFNVMEEQLQKIRMPTLHELVEHTDKRNVVSRNVQDAERHGLRRLRLMRVLEPIRKLVVASALHARSLPNGALMVLEAYLKALLDGLIVLDGVRAHRDVEEEHIIAEVRSRLDKMTGACVEAGREISRRYFDERDMISIDHVMKSISLLLQKHSKRSDDSAGKWKWWIASFLHLRLQEFLKAIQKCSVVDASDDLLRAACVAERCERMWFERDSNGISSNTAQSGLLEVARRCYVLATDWSKAANVSLKVLSNVLQTISIERHANERKILQKAGRCFAADMALAFEADEPVDMLLTSSLRLDFLLSVIMEYCTYIKQSFSASVIYQKPLDALQNLQRVRGLILQFLHDTSSRRVCPQRELHFIWVSFSCRASPQVTKDDIEALSRISSRRKHGKCQGHSSSDFLASGKDKIECSKGHASLVTSLSNSIIATSERDTMTIEKELQEAQSIIASAHDLSRDLELMHMCAEILQWISAVLATDDYDRVSLLAYEVCEVCRTKLGISTAAVFLLDSCRHLSTLGLRREGFVLLHSGCEKGNENMSTRRSAGKTRQEPDFEHQDETSRRRENALEGDAIEFLERAQRRLKLTLLPFMNLVHRKRPSVPEKRHQLGGVSIEVSFDIRAEFGQARLRDLLILLESLYESGNLLLLFENLADGRYYIEQCLLLASECLPNNAFFLQFLSALTLATKTTTADSELQCQTTLLEIASNLKQDHCTMRNRSSKGVTIQSICLVTLEKLSNRFTSDLQSPIGKELLSALDSSGALSDLKLCSDGCFAAASLALVFCRALIDAFMRNNASALERFATVMEHHPEAPFSTKLASAFVSARCLLQEAGGLGSIINGLAFEHGIAKDTKRRVTRSRTRKGVGSNTASKAVITGQGVRAVLARIEPEITAGYFCPQFCRRLWNLSGVLEDDKDAALASLIKSIGCTFDLRWASSMRGKARRKPKLVSEQKNVVDRLEDAFRQMSIDTAENVSLDTDIDIAQLQESLHNAGCIVTGLSIDETMKYLTVWRISSDVTMSKRLLLPDNSTTSMLGVTQRFSDVVAGMKAKAVKAGQILTEKEKEEWWEHRYDLDAEVKNIVSDIEEEWLGDARMLLIPSMFEDSALRKQLRAEDSSCCERLIRLSKAAFPELNAGAVHEDANQLHWKDTSITNGDVSMGELVLVMDSALEHIPWESLPVLRELNVSVTRAPSVRFLTHHLRQSTHQIDPQSLFYVVNPGGDLHRTEETFKELQGYSTWSGSFGKVSKEEVSSAYNNEQVYLYCGHGAGEIYLSPRKFSKHGTAPVALLMGCSSARRDNLHMGNCESNGSAIDYLVHGSHAVVGNLWDVGDKDIDRFTTSLLSHWLGVGREGAEEESDLMSLAESVAAARSACRLPYLVGAATIVIGVPQIWAGTGDQAQCS